MQPKYFSVRVLSFQNWFLHLPENNDPSPTTHDIPATSLLNRLCACVFLCFGYSAQYNSLTFFTDFSSKVSLRAIAGKIAIAPMFIAVSVVQTGVFTAASVTCISEICEHTMNHVHAYSYRNDNPPPPSPHSTLQKKQWTSYSDTPPTPRAQKINKKTPHNLMCIKLLHKPSQAHDPRH